MEEEVEDIPELPQPAAAAAAAAAESGAIIFESKTSPDSSALKDMNNPLFLNHGTNNARVYIFVALSSRRNVYIYRSTTRQPSGGWAERGSAESECVYFNPN